MLEFKFEHYFFAFGREHDVKNPTNPALPQISKSLPQHLAHVPQFF